MLKFDNDYLYEALGDLINHEVNPRTGKTMRHWYLKCFFAIGKDTALKIASIARADGKDKKRYFSVLLKQAAAKAESLKTD